MIVKNYFTSFLAMKIITKYKKVIIISLIIIVALMIFNNNTTAEKTAEDFIEAMLDNNANKVVSLMSDITVQELGYNSEKLLTYDIEESLNKSSEYYKNTYGNRWTYTVSAIDSYTVDFSDIEDFVEITDSVSSNLTEIVILVEHRGRGLFNNNEGNERLIVTCIKQESRWYVLYVK